MNPMPCFDPEILERYNLPGPRYTSYPTAPQFTEAFTETQFRSHVQSSNARLIPTPLSLYLHIPYCHSPCFYCGCTRVITRDEGMAERYLRQLEAEIALVGPLFDARRPVLQLHLGGGTPNFLRPQQIGRLLASLRQHFSLSSEACRDFSIELDPRFVQSGDIAQLADLGFNRVSLGVQDFTPEVQRAVNRLQSVEQTLGVIAACRSNGFRSVNVDLIYGLPRQSHAGFANTLRILGEVRPDRLAVYSYAHMPKLFKAQRQIDAAELPDAATKLSLLQLAIERLGASGYHYIGMDHFALPEDDLARALAAGALHRNFMGYTTHADCDLLGLGVSAISHIGTSFSQNERDLHRWTQALAEGRIPLWRGRELDRDDVIRADVIQQLMCKGEIDIGATERRHEIDFLGYFTPSLEKLIPLVADGLVTVCGSHISATPRGRLLMRTVAMCFDRYLPAWPVRAEAERFSKVV